MPFWCLPGVHPTDLHFYGKYLPGRFGAEKHRRLARFFGKHHSAGTLFEEGVMWNRWVFVKPGNWLFVFFFSLDRSSFFFSQVWFEITSLKPLLPCKISSIWDGFLWWQTDDLVSRIFSQSQFDSCCGILAYLRSQSKFRFIPSCHSQTLWSSAEELYA